MLKVLIIYYSSGGSTRRLAHLIARGVGEFSLEHENQEPGSLGMEHQGIEAVIRTVPAISSKTEAVENPIPETGDLYVTKQELAECDGLIVGSPTRFGNMAAPLKYFFDQTSELWMNGKLANKPVSFFTSSSSMHGGQESTLLTMMIPFLHHGMLVCGLPYSETDLLHTQSGGTPYGVSHWDGHNSDQAISEHEKRLAIAQGKRVAQLAVKLKN